MINGSYHKKDVLKMEAFKKWWIEMDFKKASSKITKISEYEKLDAVLYIMFRQQREKNMPVSGTLLQEKTKLLLERLYFATTEIFPAIETKDHDFFFQ